VGSRVQDLKFRVQDLGCGVQGSGFRVQVSELRVYGRGFSVYGSECISRTHGVFIERWVRFTFGAVGFRA